MVKPSAMPNSLPARQVALLGSLDLVCGIVVATALAGETFTPLQLAGAPSSWLACGSARPPSPCRDRCSKGGFCLAPLPADCR